MAIISFKRTKDQSGNKNTSPQTSVNENYQFITDTLNESPVTFLQYSSLPALGTPHPDDDSLRVEGYSYSRGEAPQQHFVSVEYASRTGTFTSPDGNPLNDPVEFNLTFNRYSKPVMFGYWKPPGGGGAGVDSLGFEQTQRLITNSAVDPFVPPADRIVSTPIAHFRRNVASVSLVDLIALDNCINSDPWFGLQPHQGLLQFNDVSLERERNGIHYVRVQYDVLINYETWSLILADMGLRQALLDPSTGNYGFYPCTDMGGSAVTTPVNLDGFGKQLPLDDYVPGGAYPAFHYETYRIYREAAFTPLGLI